MTFFFIEVENNKGQVYVGTISEIYVNKEPPLALLSQLI